MGAARVGADSCRVAAWVFLRLLGVIYLFAFASLWPQIHGLIGSRGLLPVEPFLQESFRAAGPSAWWQFPTLLWLNAGDGMLHALCAAGCLCSLILIVGGAPALSLSLLWGCYLSLAVAGRQFFAFRWDMLLLETGFLAIVLAPLRLRPGLAGGPPPSRIAVWLLRWLLFRLVFSAGVIKLITGDAAWRNLSALSYHYETQPLPTWLGWYAHQLPGWFHAASTALTHAIGLAVPWGMAGGRRIRAWVAILIIAWQLWILLTGNYFVLNLITIALCLLLLDDAVWPARLRRLLLGRGAPEGERPAWRWPSWILGPVAALVAATSGLQMAQAVGIPLALPPSLGSASPFIAPLRLASPYGMFGVMVTERRELLLEGSVDGAHWQAYEFRCKPGTVSRAPCFASLEVPRLDWLLWYVPLEPDFHAEWFVALCERLLQGIPDVRRLFADGPFTARPPIHLRVVEYAYRFTDISTRRRTGAWWERDARRIFGPELSAKATEGLSTTSVDATP